MLMRIIIIQLSGFRFSKCKSLNSLSTDFVNYGNDSNFVCSLATVFLFINKLCQTSVAGSDLTPWRWRERSVRRRTIRRRRRERSVIGLKKTGSGSYLGWLCFAVQPLVSRK